MTPFSQRILLWAMAKGSLFTVTNSTESHKDHVCQKAYTVFVIHIIYTNYTILPSHFNNLFISDKELVSSGVLVLGTDRVGDSLVLCLFNGRLVVLKPKSLDMDQYQSSIFYNHLPGPHRRSSPGICPPPCQGNPPINKTPHVNKGQIQKDTPKKGGQYDQTFCSPCAPPPSAPLTLSMNPPDWAGCCCC